MLTILTPQANVEVLPELISTSGKLTRVSDISTCARSTQEIKIIRTQPIKRIVQGVNKIGAYGSDKSHDQCGTFSAFNPKALKYKQWQVF
jgi:hypothetical protein